MDNTLTRFVWNADEYYSNSNVQDDAAKSLLVHVHFNGTECVLDVGCGDGKITAKIAHKVPSGSVLGIDVSSEMIKFAQKTFPRNRYQNLEFSLKDAQKLDYREHFDIVFSSFALQWVLDQHSFFQGAYNSLKKSGHLVITIPLGISSALEESISKIKSQEKWSSYFREFVQEWHFDSDIKFSKLLSQYQFAPILFSVITQEVVFHSRDDFEKYILQWLPYLQPLPSSLRQVFFKEIIDKYIEIEPILNNGNILFRFPRIDIIASKVIP